MTLLFPDQVNLSRPPLVTLTSAYATEKASATNAALYALPLSVAAAIDTLGTSTHLLDEHAVSNSLASIAPVLQKTYDENRSLYGLIGDVGTTMVGASLISKGLRVGGIVDSGLGMLGERGAVAASYLVTDAKRVEVLKDMYSQKINLEAGINGIRDFTKLTDVKELANSVRLKQFTNNLKDTVATEAFTAVFQKDSKFYFPEGMTTRDVAWSAAGGALFGLVPGQVVLRAGLKRLNARAGELLAESAPKVSGSAATDLMAGIYGSAQANNLVNSGNLTGEVLGTVQANRTANDILIKNSTKVLAKSTPVTGLHTDVSTTIDISKAAIALTDFGKANPRLAVNIEAIDNALLGDNLGLKIDRQIASNEFEIKKLTASVANMNPAQATGVNININTLKSQIDDMKNNLTFAKLNRFGYVEEISSKSQNTIADFNAVTAKAMKSKTGATSDVFLTSAPQANNLVGINSTGQLFSGQKKIATTLGMRLVDSTKVYQSMDKAANYLVESLKLPESVFKRTAITANSAHETLDYILHAVDKKQLDMNALERVFNFAPDVSSIDNIRLAALKNKYTRMTEMLANTKANYTIGDIAHATNLRLNDDLGQPNATLAWINDLYKVGGKDAMSEFKTYQDAMRGFQLHYGVGVSKNTVQDVLSKDPQVFHNMLHLDMAGNFKNIEPLTITFRNHQDAGLLPYVHQYNTVARASQEVMQSSLRNSIAGHADINPIIAPVVKNMQDLTQVVDKVRAGVFGVDQSQQVASTITKVGDVLPRTRNFINRFVPNFTEAGMIEDTIKRGIAQRTIADMSQNLVATREIMMRHNADHMQELLNYMTTRQQGWRISADGIKNGTFDLETLGNAGARNIEIAKQMKLSKVPKSLPDPIKNDGSPLVMREKSLAALKELRRYSDMQYATDSRLLASMGKAPKEYDHGHVIIPSRYGKEAVYITNTAGQQIDFVLGNSLEQAKAAALVRIAAHPQKETLGIVTSANIEQYKLLRDQAWNSNVINVGDSLAKAGRKDAGGRTSVIIDPKYVSAMITEIGNSFKRQGSRYLQAEFSTEIAHLNYMQQVAGVDVKGFRGNNSMADVYSSYVNQLTGGFNDTSGSLFTTVNDIAETNINAVYQGISDAIQPAIAKSGFQSAHIKSVAAKLASKYGKSPEQFAIDMVSRGQNGVAATNPIRNLINKSASFTSFMALKMFEIGHGLLTSASLMTTIPHTMSIFRTLKNETFAGKQERLGYLADMLPDGMAMPNEVKMTLNTIHKWMNNEYKQVLSDASKAGYLDAPFSEFMKSLGDAAAGGSERWMNKVLDKSGIVSEKSEQMARQISFLTAYDMFKNAGRNGHEISMAAANDIANRIIADYRPSQKSSVFKGSFGTPLSLFQTFSTNYYQKMFQSIENKETRSLAVRFATQAFVFGGSSVPGYDFFTQNMFNNYDGSKTPEAALKGIANKNVADVLMYGSLSNVPKLFGADGIALTSRGAMQLPKMLANPMDIMSSPAPSMISNAISTIGTGLKALSETGSLGTRQMQESLILAMPNRPMRGVLEIAQGYSVNHSHNLVNANTRDTISVIARIAGLKPQQEAEQAKAMALDRASVLLQQQRRARLSDAVQASMRNNEFNGNKVNTALKEYVATGGNLDHARTWLSDLAKKSTQDVFTAKLMKSLKHDPNSASTIRFLQSTNETNFTQ
jgi:hypothetical protein